MFLRSPKTLKRCVLCVFLVASVLITALSQQVPGKVDFRRDVQPIFNQYCIECHGASQQMHGFRLDRRRDAMRGVTTVVIKPGNGVASRLYLKLIGNQYGPRMPLNGALNQEQINVIKAWIDQGAEWPDDLSGDIPSAPPDPKATQVMEALRLCDGRAFEKLVRDDPKVGNLKGPGGATPLMQAALYGDLSSVRMLLENGADPNIRNEAGASALMWAVNDLEKTRLLLEHGADVNATSSDGRTPLLIAAGQVGNSEVVKFLLDRGANLSAKSPAGLGYSTALSEAARAGDEALVRLLIDRGADVKSAGVPLLVNTSHNPKCLDMLLAHSDKKTATAAALILAASGDPQVAITMLRHGVDVNAKNPKGDTILMLTASSDAIPVEAVKSLVDGGADLNAKNPESKTALDFARQRGSTPVVDLLLKAGAKEGASSASERPAFSSKPPASIRIALERSIPLLQKTDSEFLRKARCVSCHHNTLTAVTVATARKNGFKVDDQIARDQVNKISSFIETSRERLLQGVAGGGDSITLGYILMGLAAENYKPDAATDAMARFVLTRQRPDGKWEAGAHRPPLESNENISVTSISLRALRAFAPKAQQPKYETAVRLAADWLLKARPRTTQERAFHLLGLHWAGISASNAIVRQAVSDLLREQRSDGGWAQLPSLTSDAYATGQALFALRQAGAVDARNPSYKRGIALLLKTQLEDGSWFVGSRAIPLQPYFESGFPHGRDQWISAAATNWASMALASASTKR